jgi:hypothetical protein
LENLPGDDLVLVRYGIPHDVDSEWVYNQADIDHASIVWARDMGETANEELLRYYPHRRTWLLEPDDRPPQLVAYQDTASR